MAGQQTPQNSGSLTRLKSVQPEDFFGLAMYHNRGQCTSLSEIDYHRHGIAGASAVRISSN